MVREWSKSEMDPSRAEDEGSLIGAESSMSLGSRSVHVAGMRDRVPSGKTSVN